MNKKIIPILYTLLLIIVITIVALIMLLNAGKAARSPASSRLPAAQASVTPAPATQDARGTQEMSAPNVSAQKKSIRAAAIAGAADQYKFSAQIPSAWEVEAIAAIEAINIYNPKASGSNNLEKSQIFIRTFTANSFLTLSTVTIHSRQELTLTTRPAVRYDIEKKPTIAAFINQPSWRSLRHIVTDIRVSNENPSIFYVIASRPDLDSNTYEEFLASIDVLDKETSFIEPVPGFISRVTLKPFGILIDKETSLIQKERFSGYHTGADAEFADLEHEVNVSAIADGTVVRSTTAAGYGGVLVIRHVSEGKAVTAVYGHLRPESLVKNGQTVKRGERVGVLGKGGTSETDGERKHLHFAVRRDDRVDLRGYVQKESELSAWRDPLPLFR